MGAAILAKERSKSIKSIIVFCLMLLTSSHAFSTAESVQDLRYGVTLYHFYQQNYFDALTELMVGQELQQLPSHGDNAELLKGGMSLSYGLDRSAEEIFNRLLSDSVAGVDRSKAWFYLAKLQYQRGDFNRAARALKKMGRLNDGPMAQEAAYIQARISLNEGDISSSDALIAGLPVQSPWLPYYYYNLGVVEINQGNIQQGANAFRQLEALPVLTAEEKALRDRAYTASGFANMANGDLEQAKRDFSKVRLGSPLVDRALLGYGWAFAQQNDYRAALSPWQQLSKGSLLYPSVQESLLAVPFAYESLGSASNALVHYRLAVTAYQQEITRINSAIKVFDQQSLGDLFDLSSDNDDEWLTAGEILPINKQAPYLAQLIASYKFQEAIKDLRDLNTMSRYLRQARQRVSVLETVDKEQHELWQQVIDQSMMATLQQRHKDIVVKQEYLQAQLASVVAENDGRRLASQKQSRLWEKLEQAEQRVGKLASAGKDVSKAKHQLAVFRGLMVWEDNESYPANVWEQQKALRTVTALDDKSSASLQRIEALVNNRQQSFLAPRIADIGKRLNDYQLQVDNRKADAEARIRTLAVSELNKQQQRLAHYLGQAKLAVARLYDRGSIERLQ